MARERIGKTSDVPEGRGLRVTAHGRDIAVFCVDDEYFAIDNACPHAGFPLSEGLLEGHTIICTAHGWEFDVRTGLGGQNTFSPPLGCFSVERDGDDLWIEVADGEVGPADADGPRRR